MLNAYNINTQELAVNDNVSFAVNGVITGRCNCTPVISHDVGSAAVSLNAPGIYFVTVNADVATTGDAGVVSMQLYDGADEVAGAEASAYSSAVTSPANLSFTTLVRVAPNCRTFCGNVPAVLTVRNIGVDATYTNAVITVTKVG